MKTKTLRERLARAIYAALDPNGSDPFDDAVARKHALQTNPTPMVAQAYAAADAALDVVLEDVADAIAYCEDVCEAAAAIRQLGKETAE